MKATTKTLGKIAADAVRRMERQGRIAGLTTIPRTVTPCHELKRLRVQTGKAIGALQNIELIALRATTDPAGQPKAISLILDLATMAIDQMGRVYEEQPNEPKAHVGG
jgi:hypothetical protein